MTRGTTLASTLAALAVLAACPRPPPPPGLGRRIAEGEVISLLPSADGEWLAWLDGCAPVRRPGLPAGTASCDLRVAPGAGGETQTVARGVSSLPGAYAWSAEGHVLAALDAQDLERGEGALVAWVPGGEPRRLAEGVRFWAFAPAGRLLAFAWRGQLLLWRPGAEAEPVEGASGIATFAFHPRGAAGSPLLLARRGAGAGGDLLAVTPGVKPVRAGGPVADYAFSPSGDRFAFTEQRGAALELRAGRSREPQRRGPVLGAEVPAFAFSSDGASLAFIAGVTPGQQGDLWVAPLASAGEPVRLARGVGEFRWARQAARLAWLEQFDPRVRSGSIAAGAPGLPAPPLGRNVSAYDLAPDGGALAFLQHTAQGGYSVDLVLARAGEALPVARGVYGFALAPEGGSLWYRSGCTRNAEACDLWSVPVGEPGKARRVAEGVKSFEWDRRRPGRLLLSWMRKERVALDLAVWQDGKTLAVDRSAVPGTAHFLAPDSRRLAYAVNEPGRTGVYVAEVP